ncbi:MAG: TetR family transcriptional regulator [Gemmatimonadota bacterium]|nr:TetR family transcriptional regulator [Gemmatimonadota bacterium]
MTTLTTRGRATRTRIVEAAARLVHLNGVAATTVDQVLEEAGAGKSQFYHYFGTKDDLVEAVLEFQAAVSEGEQTRILEQHPGWDGIRVWLDAVVEGQRRADYAGGCPIGSMAAEMADRDPELRVRLGEAFERKRAALEHRLRELQDDGELDGAAEPEGLATFVIATLQGALLLTSTLKHDHALAQAVGETWRHLVSFRR